MTVLTPPTSPVEQLIFDPDTTPLEVTNDPYALLDQAYPTPPIDARYAEPTDADGDPLIALRYRNREITLSIDVYSASDAGLTAARGALAAKIAKLNRYGGTLQRTIPDGHTITFDVLEASLEFTDDLAYSVGRRSIATIKLTGKPFGYGSELALTALLEWVAGGTAETFSETTLPALIFTGPAPPGDVPALGRLVVNELQGVDQAWMVAGLQVRDFNVADPATEKLFYEAEDCTPLNTAAIATVTGASGGGSNNAVTEGTLTTSFTGVLSTQAAGGGAHLAHVGTYRVLARTLRPTSNTGAVTVALDWATGDFRGYTRNAASTWAANEAEGLFVDVDLGTIRLPRAATGTQKWEGRIVAKSTVPGDDISIDCLWLVPVDEFSGEASATIRTEAITTYSARDGFDQAAGAATGKTLPVGGTWAGAGDADDFNVDATFHTLERTAVSDAGTSLATGRLLTANGTTALTNTLVGLDYVTGLTTSAGMLAGVIARYVDSSNFLAAYAESATPTTYTVTITKRVAGLDTVLLTTTVSGHGAESNGPPSRLTLLVTASGNILVRTYFAAGGPTALTDASTPVGEFRTYDAVLAPGATLDNGAVGVIERYTSASASTRRYDGFFAVAATPDAAIFGSQSAQFRHDGAIREDSAGAVYAPQSKYEGDMFLVPPAGAEERSFRCIVKSSRGLPGAADPAIDDSSASLYCTPRWLVVPS